jgi:hypothetical protein
VDFWGIWAVFVFSRNDAHEHCKYHSSWGGSQRRIPLEIPGMQVGNILIQEVDGAAERMY